MENSKNVDANNKNDEEENPYDSMVRSLTNRGKNKRKVKLIENQLIQFAFGESDSEDDEDFMVDNDDINSDDSNIEIASEDEQDANEDDEDDDGDSSEEGDNAQSDGESSQDGEKPIKLDMILSAFRNQPQQRDSPLSFDENSQDGADVTTFKKPLLICGICLESEDSEKDEILECDQCGITVHEGCYGDIDLSDDGDKSDSDAPTEPWFCDPCKAGRDEKPMCELCPNIGGIYKQTDTGKWVHLICALYTPYVGFRDVSKLRTVVLEDVKCSMWGSKECMICVDDNFSRTGVCINCDVGMCKTTFHVTCAQKNGFLSEIPDRGDAVEDTPDMLYAHCKLHSEKNVLRKRKNGWLAFFSHSSNFRRGVDDVEKERIDAALKSARAEYHEFRRCISPSKPLPQEFPRLLSSCPEACMMLARKAEILGLLRHPGYNVAAAVTSGRISKHEANLSAEFVNYFFKREMQVKETHLTLRNAEPSLLKLQKEQTALTKMSEEYQKQLEKVFEEKEKLIAACKTLHQCISKLTGKPFKLPSMLKPKDTKQSKAKIEESSKLLNTIVNKCATCKSTEDQHLLTKCETCKNYYHLACVDPPLLRMPKKSDKYVWQCTECDSSEESESEVEFIDENDDGDGKRRTKRTTREPTKFTPEDKKTKELLQKSLKRKDTSKSEEKPKKIKLPENNQKKSQKARKKEKYTKKRNDTHKCVKKVKPQAETFENCCVCNKSGDKSNLVKCDECKKCYHFQTCLDPPYNRTPKGKFWGWICEDCDESEEEIEDVENEDEVKGNNSK